MQPLAVVRVRCVGAATVAVVRVRCVGAATCGATAISATCSECVFEAQLATVQFACATLPSVASRAIQYFSTLSHKRQD